MTHRVLGALAAASFIVSAHATTKQDVQDALDTMQLYYNATSGQWGNDVYGWWHESNIIEAVANSMILTNDSLGYSGLLESTWEKTNQSFQYYVTHNGYDDIAWSGLAWVRVYRLTGDRKYLSRSYQCFEQIVATWDDHCGGGVWWDRALSYKNAITNELFLTLSTELYDVMQNVSYLQWAQKEWGWFKTTAMVRSDHLIADGLTGDCGTTGTTWTYNQGVMFLGLYDLYKYTGDVSTIDFAFSTAAAVASSTLLTDANGVLQEASGMSDSGSDGWQFKGIYMRYLSYLVRNVEGNGHINATYATQVTNAKRYLATSATSILANDKAANNSFGYFYQGPPMYNGYISHSSGFDAVTGAYGM
eukprot:TRINITY_DN13169_c0_g1_i1.p1 TRINITY_DN13169_c0_g1~~TRINITY_DN13169_c0_g1_i1.p1  ORF type:complete len:375 (+),score=96.10 TRINITY_DN13169_c0_g1_i1:43-1125(+)